MNAHAFEQLESRWLFAITATFNSSTGVLAVNGDDGNNTIVVSRNVNGRLFVNGGAVGISGGIATIANTNTIKVFARFLFSIRPSAPIASRKSFVFAALNPNSSMTITFPSRSLSERAERIAPRRIFFGILYDQSRGCGP